jgi:CRP-like cAMP-binding protein
MALEVCSVSQSLSCLRRVPIFEGLTEQEMTKLYSMTQEKNYDKGECIFQAGEHSESLYVVNQGLIKLSQVSNGGKEQIFRFLFPGDFFGQFAMLQDKPHYANAEAVDASVVYQIQKRHIKYLMESNPDMMYRFLIAVSEQLHQADEWMGAMNLLEVEHRLAKTLFFFYQKNYNTDCILDISVAKKELAAMIGITSGTLSRKLADLEDLNIIATRNRKIRILDPARLSELAGE